MSSRVTKTRDQADRGSDAAEPLIRVERLSKWFGAFQVLIDIDLMVARGEKIVICGPSGSGKSTFIRCLNGLEPHQAGSINVAGIELTENADALNQVRRRLGMVFQSFNLFPHMKVLANLTVGPVWIRGEDRRAAEERAYHFLERVHIRDQAHKYPAQLSGGQQQRVAIARALCMKPEIMLFDEPTSALDPEMVKEVLDTMADLVRDGMTMLIITHELNFAREIADRILFMDGGRKVEEGKPEAFFANPQTERARVFLEKVLHH